MPTYSKVNDLLKDEKDNSVLQFSTNLHEQFKKAVISHEYSSSYSPISSLPKDINPTKEFQKWAEITDIKNSFQPNSEYNRILLAEKLPATSYIQIKILEQHLPTCEHKTAVCFDFIELLNQEKLQLPEKFFLKKDDMLDTALSPEGATHFMHDYAKKRNIQGKVFKHMGYLKEELQHIKEAMQKQPIACLVYTDRHVTGFYFTIEQDKPTVFLFDSVGLTLPGIPCTFRYYKKSYFPWLDYIIKALQDYDIQVAITPINTLFSLQKDYFSCFSNTLLFFEAMINNAYETYASLDITNCFSLAAFFLSPENELKFVRLSSVRDFWLFHPKPVVKYVISDLPFLIGCQNEIALPFMLDPLKKADEIYPQVIKYQTNWQRRMKKGLSKIQNVFAQVVYLELLSWFNAQHHKQNLPFPDLKKIATSHSLRKDKSSFEQKIHEIQVKQPHLKKKILSKHSMCKHSEKKTSSKTGYSKPTCQNKPKLL